jgi:hypothetical protein
MAVFLLKAAYGSDYLPSPCQGIFTDVTCPSPFADWIEQLYAFQIAAGCGGARSVRTTRTREGRWRRS